MTEASLCDLLQDMLTLQSEVFTCISQDSCYKVHTILGYWKIFAGKRACNFQVLLMGLLSDKLSVHTDCALPYHLLSISVMPHGHTCYWTLILLLHILILIINHQIFTESLLCSNDVTMINVASELLTVTPSPPSPPPTSPRATPTSTGSPMESFNYHLSYETSLELVHSAAKEYFNSAQSFMDDDMNLARYLNSTI